MHSITQVVIDLLGLAVITGVLIMAFNNVGGVNSLIVASGSSIANVTRSLEGRGQK
jgi:hypothetical protein